TDYVCNRLIEVKTHSTTDHRFAFSNGIIGKADSRTKVRELPFIRPIDSLTNPEELILGKIKNSQMVQNLIWNTVVFPTEAKVPRKRGVHFKVILKKLIDGTDAKIIIHGNLLLSRCRWCAEKKCGKSRKCDGPAGEQVEVVVLETPEFAPKLYRVPAV